MTTTADARKLAKLASSLIDKIADGRAELKAIDKTLLSELKTLEREVARIVKDACAARERVFGKLETQFGKLEAASEEIDPENDIDWDRYESPMARMEAYDEPFDCASHLESFDSEVGSLHEALTEIDFDEPLKALSDEIKTYAAAAAAYEEPDEDEDDDDTLTWVVESSSTSPDQWLKVLGEAIPGEIKAFPVRRGLYGAEWARPDRHYFLLTLSNHRDTTPEEVETELNEASEVEKYARAG